MTLIDQIRDLIAEGNTQRSLDELYKYVKENNADVIDNLVMLRSRMQNLQSAVHNGTMDDQAATLERAKINEAILKLLPQLTPEYLAEASKRKETPHHRPATAAAATSAGTTQAPAQDMKKWYLIGGGVLLLIVLLIAMLNGGGDAEEGEAQIAADSSATVTALPDNTSGNVAQQMTKIKPKPQPQTQQEEQQVQQEFQEQQVQTGHAKEDLSLEWQSGDGSISFVTQDGINWSETAGGVVKFKFKTTDVTDEYIEIYDASRQMTLRIIDNGVYFYDAGQDQWNLLVNGEWLE